MSAKITTETTKSKRLIYCLVVNHELKYCQLQDGLGVSRQTKSAREGKLTAHTGVKRNETRRGPEYLLWSHYLFAA